MSRRGHQSLQPDHGAESTAGGMYTLLTPRGILTEYLSCLLIFSLWQIQNNFPSLLQQLLFSDGVLFTVVRTGQPVTHLRSQQSQITTIQLFPDGQILKPTYTPGQNKIKNNIPTNEKSLSKEE